MKAFFIFCFTAVMTTSATAAFYQVPVVPQLKKYATFELHNFKKTVEGNKVIIEYSLPDTLTGADETIHLEGRVFGERNELLMFGEKGIARCVNVDSYNTCSIDYYGLVIDQAAALEAIKKISKSDDETLGRLEVTRAFSGDPHGIISY